MTADYLKQSRRDINSLDAQIQELEKQKRALLERNDMISRSPLLREMGERGIGEKTLFYRVSPGISNAFEYLRTNPEKGYLGFYCSLDDFNQKNRDPSHQIRWEDNVMMFDNYYNALRSVQGAFLTERNQGSDFWVAEFSFERKDMLGKPKVLNLIDERGNPLERFAVYRSPDTVTRFVKPENNYSR